MIKCKSSGSNYAYATLVLKSKAVLPLGHPFFPYRRSGHYPLLCRI